MLPEFMGMTTMGGGEADASFVQPLKVMHEVNHLIPTGRELRDHYNATVPSKRGGEIKDVDPGTTDEVHPMDYAARQSIPETIRIQEDMSTSKKGR